MSQLIVEVCQIDEVKPHPKPEVHSLEIVTVKGWQCVTKKGQFAKGDKVVYFPPDTMLPVAVSDSLGVTNYLASGRVRTIKLQGEISFGLTVVPKEASWRIGQDVAAAYSATKYEPPVRARGLGKGWTKTEQAPDHPDFWKYTDIQNLRHSPNAIADGDEVVMVEKCHGACWRGGVVKDQKTGKSEGFVGSRNTVRRPPHKVVPAPKATGMLGPIKNLFTYAVNGFRWPLVKQEDPSKFASDWYYSVTMNHRGVLDLLREVYAQGHNQVELFGETFGGGVQSMDYGSANKLRFAAFDILIDGKYLDYDPFVELCQKYNIPICPVVYRGPYSFEKAKQASMGNTLMGGTHIREGVVVKPLKETNGGRGGGRTIFKMINDDYLLAKEPNKKGVVDVTDSTDE
jgi:RNA ligase (TIGR02306 family)